MSWLQAYDVCVPHYDLQDGKFVFALALQHRSSRPRPRSHREGLATPCVTAQRSYSEFRRLWKDLERATRTPNALAATTAALSGDAKASFTRRSRRSRTSSSSIDSNASTASSMSSASSSFRASLRFSSARSNSTESETPTSSHNNESAAPVTVSAASGCLCSNFCCPFERLHSFVKAYNFPSKFVIKKSAQAVLDSRRSALELFLSRLRAQFDQFPRLLLQRVEAAERCVVLELLARFVGLSSELRASIVPGRMPLTIASWRPVDVVAAQCESESDNNKTPDCEEGKVTKADVIDDEVEAAEIPVEGGDSELSSPTAAESPSHSFLFVPQLSPWPEETIDENGEYEDETMGETMPIDLDQDGEEEEEEEEQAQRSVEQQEQAPSPPSVVIPTSYRERSATESMSPRNDRKTAIQSSQRASQTQQHLPKLHIRWTKVNTVRSFIEDVREHLHFRRRTRSRTSSSDIFATADVRNSRGSATADERQWGYALYVASQIGHMSAVATILRHGTDPNATGEDEGVSSLHAACRGGHREAAALLLAAGAEVNTSDARGMTPLLSAIHAGDLALVQQLLSAGADVNAFTVNNVSAVHVAVACQALLMLALLLERGANVNSANAYNRKTPLHIAAELGNYGICKLLLRYGADTYARTDRGVDAVTLASMNARHAVAELCRQYQHTATLRALGGDSCVAELRRTMPCCPVYTTVADGDQASGADSDEDDGGCGLVVPTVTFISEDGQNYAVL